MDDEHVQKIAGLLEELRAVVGRRMAADDDLDIPHVMTALTMMAVDGACYAGFDEEHLVEHIRRTFRNRSAAEGL